MAVSDLRSPLTPSRSLFRSIKFFVLCQSALQLAQLLVSGYMKSSISTIERRYGLSSQKAGLLAAFNEVGNTVLIVSVSFLGSRVHRPRFIAGGALLAALASMLMALPHFIYGPYDYTDRVTVILLNEETEQKLRQHRVRELQQKQKSFRWRVFVEGAPQCVDISSLSELGPNLCYSHKRFLGLQVCGGLLCFLLTMILLQRRASTQDQTTENKPVYKLVNLTATAENQAEEDGTKT